MIRLERAALAAALTAFFAFPLYLISNAGGPPPGRSGGPFPGEQSCATAGCHGVNSLGGPGSVSLTINGAPAADYRYRPGETAMIEVRIADPAAQRWGFQMTARKGDGCQGAGMFTAGEMQVSVSNSRRVGACGDNDLPVAQHSFPKSGGGSATFMVNWTPNQGDASPVTLAVAGNAANGNGNNSGDMIYLASVVIEPAEIVDPGPTPMISEGGAVHGASLSAEQGFAPNTFVTLFGSNFGGGLATWSESFVDGVAPTELAGIQVLVNGNAAFISFVGDGASTQRNFDQINILTPDDDARGPVNIEVVTPEGRSEPFVVTLEEDGSGLLRF